MSKPNKPATKPKRGPFDLTAREIVSLKTKIDAANRAYKFTSDGMKGDNSDMTYAIIQTATYLKARAGRKG